MKKGFARIVLLLCMSWPLVAAGDWSRDEQDVMGTRITVEVFHRNEAVRTEAIAAAMDEMHRIDAAMSPYKPDSELSRVNRSAHEGAMKITDELFRLLLRSKEYSELTRGAFDITFASAGFLYDYRAGQRPEPGELRAAVERIDYRQLILDAGQSSVRYGREGVKIDLGGIAKGHAVDQAIRLLQARGIANALVTAGGDTRVIGKRWGRPWNIGVRDPRREDKVVVMIPLENVAVSTSGDYERFFEEDGVRYHHIINPRTGDSARELQSVTVIGADATSTDALSTSVFVLGREHGMALIDSLDGVDAVLVDSAGRLHYSSGLARPEMQ